MFKQSLAVVGSTVAVIAALATPGSASTLGQPFLIADIAPSGGVLDFFDGFAPSGLKNLSASATISSTFGADALIGQQISLFSGPFSEPSLTIGRTAPDFLIGVGGFPDSFTLDGFTDGVIRLEYALSFPLNFSEDPVTGETIFTFLDPFEAFSPEPGVDFPEVFVGVDIFYDGDLPTKFFDDGFGGFDFVEGPLDVTRIELGVIGGPAIPVSAVPLPATLPLALLGLGTLAAARRKKVS